MEISYIKIPNLTYKGKEIYYSEHMSTTLKKASEFNENYIYYYVINGVDKKLGKFKCMSKVNLGCPYADTDYDVFVFEEEKIFYDKKNFIYCELITNERKNITIIQDMVYEKNNLKYNVYYENEL
jgi:hypothetical protein